MSTINSKISFPFHPFLFVFLPPSEISATKLGSGKFPRVDTRVPHAPIENNRTKKKKIYGKYVIILFKKK